MSQKPGYLLVMGIPLERETMDRYQELLSPIYATHHGQRLVKGGHANDATYLSGGLTGLSMMLARFPSPENVSDFWWSEAFREAYVVRKKTGRFSAVGLPGLDKRQDTVPGNCGYLIAMATPQSPGRWRRFADTLTTGLEDRGATILTDAGPEAIERLESLLPGSHVFIAMLPSEADTKAAWADLKPELEDQLEASEPVNIIALAGLPDDHPWRASQ